MRESIIVDGMPIASYKRTYQQQQRRFGLVEIRNQLIYYAELISGLNHYLRFGMQDVLLRTIQIIYYRLQCLSCGKCIFFLVWLKSGDRECGVVWCSVV